jgi:Protein of unknown function (DUF3089)
MLMAVAAIAGALAVSCSRSTTTITPTSATVAAAPTAVPVNPTASGPSGVQQVDYGNAANWLCRPDKTGTPCTVALDATVVAADGGLAPEPFQLAVKPAIDCFYIYPTVSTDPGLNSDLVPGDEERNAATQQFARFGAVCRLFAPMYRQVTTTALNTGRFNDPHANEIADADVLSAWRYYLDHDNGGRGVILIGHSQGSRRLIRLISEQIDPNPSSLAKLVAAYLIGAGVHVPAGADVGEDFQHVPACRRPDQVHCVVRFASFSADSPPPGNSNFGLGGVLCVNPAALAGGAADLHPYFSTSTLPVAGALTPFVTLTGQVRGECVNEAGASDLKITATSKLSARVLPRFVIGPEWGLHIIDVNLTIGDLVALAARQAAAYAGR